MNRHSELGEAAVVYDFFFDSTELLKCHPAAKTSGDVLRQLLEAGRLAVRSAPQIS